mgnify:FL=1
MKQRYNELSHEICVRSVLEALDKKWRRKDILLLMEKYGGVPRSLMLESIKEQDMNLRLDAAESIAYELEQRIKDLMNGKEDALGFAPVITTQRRDGATGKIRDIARLDIFHQILGHLLYHGLEPLLKARITPFQFASIPHRGQNGLVRKLKKSVWHVKYAVKLDVVSAYKSAQYESVIKILKKEIPNAEWIICCIEAISRIAPDGHLIIGGYLDAWLFNFLMSYAVVYLKSLHKTRRGKRTYTVKELVVYMDDFGLMGDNLHALDQAAYALSCWLDNNYQMKIKTGKATRIGERSAGKSASGLDIGGYVVRKGIVKMRRSIFRRARRQFLRAAREVDRTGTMPMFRAQKLIAYFGYFKHSNSRKAAENLRIKELLKIGRRVVGYHTRRYQEKCCI